MSKGIKLIIAEKPILGKNIAEAIDGKAQVQDGCIYKGDYVITWVFGHMLTLKRPEEYDEKYKKWDINQLPIFFPNWETRIGDDVQTKTGFMSKKQRVEQIGNLLKKADLVIHAGDPDDEGQLLVDELLRWFNYTGVVKRLDTANTTVVAMKKALANLTDNKEHESYGWSAYARTIADFTVGINMSQLFSCKNNTLLTIGRVQTPTLGLVVQRDEIIENHNKQTYFNINVEVEVEGKVIPAKFYPNKEDCNLFEGRITSPEYAKIIADRINNTKHDNIIVSKKTEYEEPPLPFNLVKLQTYCSGKFGYSPQEVLNITQSLREKHKAITYNRSDCQYLSEEHFAEAPQVITAVCSNINYMPKELDTKIKSKCFDSSKISAHFAIIPTTEKVDLNKLSEYERNVYLSICKYYLIQFLPKAKKEKTNLVIDLNNGEAIKAVSTVVIKKGYRAIFSEAKKEISTPLSELNSGKYSGSVINPSIEEKETKPPSRYTKASLNEDMTQISKYVKDKRIKELLLSKDKDKEGEKGSIGTSATRSGIIENLIKRGFLQEKGKTIISTPLGRELYRILPDEIKKADMTAEWWQIQEKIQKGELPYTELTNSVYNTMKFIIENANKYPLINHNIVPKKDDNVVGKCPRCGGNIIEGNTNYFCSNWKEKQCKFIIWKKNKSPLFAKITITKSMAKKLLNNQIIKSNNFVSKDGKKFTAAFKLKDKNSQYGAEYELIF